VADMVGCALRAIFCWHFLLFCAFHFNQAFQLIVDFFSLSTEKLLANIFRRKKIEQRANMNPSKKLEWLM
jgi:hypothetical protein